MRHIVMELEIHEAEEWSALYIDGKLERVGDSYLAVEKVFELLGVKVVQDNAFMRGQYAREGVAPTLADIESFRVERDARQAEADELAARADELQARAHAIRSEWGRS